MSSYVSSDFNCDFVMDTSEYGPRMSRMSLFNFWRSIPPKGKLEGVIKFVKSKFAHLTITQDGEHELFLFLRNECEKIRVKWNRLSRKLDVFLKTHEAWLSEDLLLHMYQEPSPKAVMCKGRPKKAFEECSSKSKRRKVQHLIDEYDDKQLSFAAHLSVRASGKRDAANLIHEVTTSSPKRATRYKNAKRPKNITKQRPYSAEEALALFIANNLSVTTYKNIQHEANERGFKLYPCYDIVAKVKKQCYPPVETLTLTDTYAEVQLQSLLTHTATRICKDILGKENLSYSQNYRLMYKWGCDGSSGHSIYKQRFEDSKDTDEYMFVISLVPIRLMTENVHKIIWENPRPSSPRFCRIIKFLFKKETDDLIKRECEAVENQIKTLVPSVINIGDGFNITVKHELVLSMIDGKVCNVLAENSSSQRCFICRATSKEMNSDAIVNKDANENMYRFGISSLHAYIRTMECLLNIASKIELKQWQVRGKSNQDIVKERRKAMIKEFKKIGLIIDKIKPGYGTSNDGNTARAFFHNYKATSQITGIDENLIYHLAIILGTLASGYEIDPDKFKNYCDETRSIYLKSYHWYNMPATLHKVLLHGPEIIRHSLIPIGQMSEEASEAKNKEIRNIRLGHCMKTSRVRTNYDMIKYLLMSSDPYISLLRKLPKKTNTKHLKDVNKLLKS